MVESTPRVPYESLGGCTQVEDNMSSRRKSAESHLRSNESILTIGSFPCLGHKTKGTVYEKNANKIFPHYLIAYDSRFVAITESIVKRKGKFVDIHIPKFLDQFTEITRTDIVLDGTGFGMGLCCLQLTIQMPNVHRSLLLYDYLANITPIMMALTASTPIHGGFLTNLDCRWSIIEQSVDDRNSKSLISKSRYSSIATFLTRNPAYAESLSNFNDGIPQSMSIMTQFEPKIIKKECEVCSELSSCSENEFDWKNSHYPNEWSLPLELYERLVDGIKDPMLVSHFSYILSIDPIITHDAPDLSDRFCYENIQSTNWQSLRLKIPSAEDVSLGWRVEFRTMEIQPSDYENAAFTVFVYLLSRAFDAATSKLKVRTFKP